MTGRTAIRPGEAEFLVEELSVAVVHLAARGSRDALSVAVNDALGTQLPDGARCAQAGPLRLLGIAPGRWLAVRQPADHDFAADLAMLLRAGAAVCDLTDAYVVWRLRGAAVRSTLARLIAIDLHERAFREGDVAATVAAHTPVILWRVSSRDETAFELAVPRSYAASLREVLDECIAAAGPPPGG